MPGRPGRHAWLWCLRTLALAVPAPHAPAALADDEALRLSATAPAAAWELGPTAQVNWTCGAGRRNADASECLAAVVVASGGAANGRIKFLDTAGIPPGCSYSHVSGAAMFNAGAGQVGSELENYQLVCTDARGPETGTDDASQPHASAGQKTVCGSPFSSSMASHLLAPPVSQMAPDASPLEVLTSQEHDLALWNSLAVNDIDTPAEKDTLRTRLEVDTHTLSDALAKQLEKAVINGELPMGGASAADLIYLERSLIAVPLSEDLQTARAGVACPAARASHFEMTGMTVGGPFGKVCRWASLWASFLGDFDRRNPGAWQTILDNTTTCMPGNVAFVAHDAGSAALRLQGGPAEAISKMIGMHVIWMSVPTSVVQQDAAIHSCTHVVPTIFEMNHMGMLTVEDNQAYTVRLPHHQLLGEVPKWEQRSSQIYYRGSAGFSSQRRQLYAMAAADPQPAWLNANETNSTSAHVFGSYKYALDIGGVSGTTWNALRNKMRLGSLVFRVESGFADWWHGDLLPGVHFLPIKGDLSDLEAQYKWAEANPERAKEIAEAGRAKETESATDAAMDGQIERVLRSLAGKGSCF